MSEKTPTHTNMPWRVVDRPSQGLIIEWGPDDGTMRPICHMRWTDGLRPEVEARVAADAAYLVRCVNSHEDLLRELKALRRRFLKCLEHCGTDDEQIRLAAVESASFAIAKAEGQS